MLVWLAMAMQADDLIARARRQLSVEPRCLDTSTAGDVVVCGRRRADLYRVPLVVHDAGDPRYESVADERRRLLARTTPVQDHGPFLVGGGMAGVHLTSGGSGTKIAGRPLAP